MISLLILITCLLAMYKAENYYLQPLNVTRSTLSGLAAYRSALTLDWMEAEDLRQRELAAAFETQSSVPAKVDSTDCIESRRPASGKVARLMLELLIHLEGDNGSVMPELIQSLVRSKLLVETAMLEAEPELEALVETPAVMMGEPHSTFPRILAMTWLAITDPVATKKYGWCHIKKVSKFLVQTKSITIAKHMKALDPVFARARFIMEEFIQHVTPLNIYQKKTKKPIRSPTLPTPLRRTPTHRSGKRTTTSTTPSTEVDVQEPWESQDYRVRTREHRDPEEGKPPNLEPEDFPVIGDEDSIVVPQSSSQTTRIFKLLLPITALVI